MERSAFELALVLHKGGSAHTIGSSIPPKRGRMKVQVRIVLVVGAVLTMVASPGETASAGVVKAGIRSPLTSRATDLGAARPGLPCMSWWASTYVTGCGSMPI